MKKHILVLFIIFFAFFTLNAQNVHVFTAKKVAENFFKIISKTSENKENNIVFSTCYVNKADTLLYIFNTNNGFVIIAADYSASPILGFSDEQTFDEQNQPPAQKEWLKNYADQLIFAKNNRLIRNNEWDKYLDLSKNNFSVLKNSPKEVEPLIASRWNQDNGYNYKCPAHPKGPDGKCYAGCVATAMSMIMKYYEYPEHGFGTYSYAHPYYGIISADFGSTYYNWDSMTNVINTMSRNAISTLMFQCGVAVNMNYSPAGSGAETSTAAEAFVKYFHYRNTISDESKYSYTDLAWRELLIDNLDQQHPILYSGNTGTDGHAWVCDGYKIEDTITYFHFNWGWGGAANGYYRLDNLYTSNGNFTAGQGAVVNIMPYFAPYCQEGRTLKSASRTIDDGSGYSLYWNDSQCDWLIEPASASKVALAFSEFETEEGKDFVSIYDGNSTSSPLLGTFSGHNLPPTLIAASGKMLITFSSDSQVQDYGWKATYSSVTSTNEEDAGAAILVFPVPTKDVLNVMIPSDMDEITLSIYNGIGQQMCSQEIDSNKESMVQFNVSSFKQGVYILEVSTSKGVVYKKFIK